MKDNRPSASKRGYGARWRKRRASFLADNPFCVYCEREHRVTVATIVDHIIPHKGNQDLMWDETNWQSLCKPHHDSVKQAEERNTKQEIGLDGWPV